MAKQKRSCDACHKRKIQCVLSDEEPACNWCNHHGMSCTFLRARGRKKVPKAPAGSTKDLKDRVQRLEKALAEHGVGSGVNTTPDTSASPSRLSDTRSTPQPAQAGSSHQSSCPAEGEQQQRDVALGQMYFAGQNLGELCARNGVPFFSPDGRQWIFSVTGQWPCFDSINFEREDGRINNNQDISRHNLAETSRNLVRLPKRSEFETRLSQFLTQDIVGVFPFVDEVLIHHTIQTAYEVGQTPQNRGQINAKACVLALFAVMSTHLDHGDTTSPMSPNEYSKEAKRLLISEGIEEATIVTLQTIVLLMMHEVPYGRLASAHMLHATACRAAFALGGHRISPPTPMNRPLTLHEREDLFLRDLFWLCYKLDKDIALRTGQPPLINDDFCNLSLPEGYLDGRFKALSLQSSSDEALSSRRTPQLPGDLRLDLLKAKVCKLLYSAESSQKSDAELLRTIRELDDELERWRVSIPAKFSPSMSVSASGTLDTELDTPMRMLHIELHLEYNHLLAVIHCASGRCTLSTNGTGKGDPGYGVQSSLQLSVEASRSTLIYLKAAGHRIASEAFWAFLCYPLSALMILFFNILRYPLADQATSDVELLKSSTHLIKSMPMKNATSYDVKYLQRIEDFISELSRLGECAIEKARSGKGDD